MKPATFFKYLRPRYLIHNARGFCPVCSRWALFLYSDDLRLIRNHAHCIRCGSVSRHRHLALSCIDAFSSRGVRWFSDFRNKNAFDILNTSSKSPIARQLTGCPRAFNTEYFDNCASGELVNGTMCQNLENLSFISSSMDLVVSEDVLEHVKDYMRAFSEIHRVLRSGGYHIFTIPFNFDRKTRELFGYREGQYVPLSLPVEYHGDGIRGKIPTFRHFGYDLFEHLGSIGFETELKISEYHEHRRYATFNCFTFVSRKL